MIEIIFEKPMWLLQAGLTVLHVYYNADLLFAFCNIVCHMIWQRACHTHLCSEHGIGGRVSNHIESNQTDLKGMFNKF